MADLTDFGIASITTALVEQFKLKKSVQIAGPVLTSVGLFSAAEAYGAEYEFSANGKGDLPADFALAGSGPTIDGLTGGVTLIENSELSQSNTGHNAWSASGTHAPAAT